MDLHHGKTSHLSILLDSCLGNDLDVSILNNNVQGLEYRFLRSEFLNEGYKWSESLVNTFKKIEANGFNLKNAYLLTHIIFYSTCFGRSSYWKYKNKLICILSDILDVFEEISRKECNWDLLREIYLSKIYLNIEDVSVIKSHFRNENSIILSSQEWFLSDGVRLKYFERKYKTLTHKERYSLFHTTIISLLLKHELNKESDNRL